MEGVSGSPTAKTARGSGSPYPSPAKCASSDRVTAGRGPTRCTSTVVMRVGRLGERSLLPLFGQREWRAGGGCTRPPRSGAGIDRPFLLDDRACRRGEATGGDHPRPVEAGG